MKKKMTVGDENQKMRVEHRSIPRSMRDEFNNSMTNKHKTPRNLFKKPLLPKKYDKKASYLTPTVDVFDPFGYDVQTTVMPSLPSNLFNVSHSNEEYTGLNDGGLQDIRSIQSQYQLQPSLPSTPNFTNLPTTIPYFPNYQTSLFPAYQDPQVSYEATHLLGGFRDTAEIYTAPEPTRIQMTPQQCSPITRIPQNPFRKRDMIQRNTSLISKEQLLNNQHLEPIYDKKASDTGSPIKRLHNQPNPETKVEQIQDTIEVDTSARKCNQWSIYGVTLPTQLHVKCHCFIPNF